MKKEMKKEILFLSLALSLGSCGSSHTATNSSSQAPVSNISSETEARNLTQKMKSILGLNTDQESKVMVLNVTNIKLIKALKENRQTDKLDATREKYHQELQGILTKEQFDKFLTVTDFRQI